MFGLSFHYVYMLLPHSFAYRAPTVFSFAGESTFVKRYSGGLPVKVIIYSRELIRQRRSNAPNICFGPRPSTTVTVCGHVDQRPNRRNRRIHRAHPIHQRSHRWANNGFKWTLAVLIRIMFNDLNERWGDTFESPSLSFKRDEKFEERRCFCYRHMNPHWKTTRCDGVRM